jgi:hypothetical protein
MNNINSRLLKQITSELDYLKEKRFILQKNIKMI